MLKVLLLPSEAAALPGGSLEENHEGKVEVLQSG